MFWVLYHRVGEVTHGILLLSNSPSTHFFYHALLRDRRFVWDKVTMYTVLVTGDSQNVLQTKTFETIEQKDNYVDKIRAANYPDKCNEFRISTFRTFQLDVWRKDEEVVLVD